VKAESKSVTRKRVAGVFMIACNRRGNNPEEFGTGNSDSRTGELVVNDFFSGNLRI